MSTSTKIILITLVILCAYCIYAYLRTKSYISAGNELADKAVAYVQHPDNPKLKFLTIGDSSVVGTGASNPKGSVAGYLGADFPKADIVNLGVNGSKVHKIPSRLRELDGQKFDLVLIHIGGNDIVRRTNLKEFERSLTDVFDEAIKLSDNIIALHGGNVGTAGLFPYGTRWIFTYRTWQVRKIYKSLAEKKGVKYIDLWRNKENDPFAADMQTYYAGDLFHPSDEGYRDWYSFIKIELDKINF